MKIADFLAPADVFIDMHALHKQQVLQGLSRKAAVSVGLEPHYVESEILKREDLGSTSLGHGVAIPHARLPGLKRLQGVVARLTPAIDFDAIDGQQVDLIFMLLLPAPSKADHLTALALVARTLKSTETLVRLRQATRESEIYAAMVGEC